jgi:hypothetical protein
MVGGKIVIFSQKREIEQVRRFHFHFFISSKEMEMTKNEK